MDRLGKWDLITYLSLLKKMFNIVRIIDPIEKKVLYNEGGDAIIHGEDCFEFWNKGNSCKNCITSHAIKEKKTFTKIEYNGDKIYMVMASPIKLEDYEYILEMLKDITETRLVEDLKNNNSKETSDIIAKLNKKIVTDPLTGVYNRRYINENFPKDIIHATEKKEKLAIIMLDIDYFKKINDIYGHVAGDMVLKEVANIISMKIRKDYDWVARYGGDEFIVLLKNAGKGTTDKIIKDIQIALENTCILFQDYMIKFTISFGSYIIEPRKEKIDEIIYIVDGNLNKAKRKGRNMVISS